MTETQDQPSPARLSWLVVLPALLAVFSIVVGLVGLLDSAETLSDVSTAGALALILLPLLFLVFLPWLGIGLIVLARSLKVGHRRTGVRIVGVVVLLIAASPWIYAAVSAIVWVLQGRPQWSP